MVANRAKKLAIIDGKSVFYRGYYAMPNLMTPDGTSTGGVYGFATMALEVIKRLQPDYVAVAWDKPKTNIRKRLAMYPEYKAGRKPAPPDFYAQIPILHELLAAFGWPLYELDDYEADDIMGTLSAQASTKGVETMLITSDLDMLQLIDPLVHVYVLKTGLSNIELYSPTSFEVKYGIKVGQFLDLKALKGDSSDNIPGVPGIGEKTASNLLKQYTTLDNIYQNIDLLPDAIKNKLVKGKDLAYLSKKLSAIWTNAPIKLNLEEMNGSKANVIELTRLLNKLQFKSLLRNLPSSLTDQISQQANDIDAINIVVGKTVQINDDEDLKKIAIKNASCVYIVSRSAGAHGHNPQSLVVSFDGSKTYLLDVKRLSRELLKKFLSSLPPLIGHNLKATVKVMINLGVQQLPEINHDTLLAGFLLNSLRRELTLSEMARADIGYQGSSLDDLDPEEFNQKASIMMATIKSLSDQQKDKIKQVKQFSWILANIDWPIIPILARMEVVGIELDGGYLRKMSEQIAEMILDVEQQIYGYADQEFNIASPSQLADVLFNKLNLPINGIKKRKNGYSTAANELEKLRYSHPIIELVSRYREIAKLKNTYVDTLPRQVDEHSRLHTTFNLTIAQTGRLSSTDPNLQNIPIKSELGRKIRTAFVAGTDKKLISADYSQFELRLAAVLAKDDGLIDLFNRGADIHLMTAAEIYGRSPEDVTKQMRSAAKTINFGILYGMSPHGLSLATGMSIEQASSFILKYKNLRRPLFDYMDRVLETAKKVGYVETLFGRRRPMPDIHSSNYIVRTAAERAAINMPIQGTEADLMKMAMIKCEEILRNQHNSRQLLQIHDSVLVECPSDVASDVAQQVQQTMQDVYKLPVRLDVSVTIGDNWGQL
jgi:DNA polymerase-1